MKQHSFGFWNYLAAAALSVGGTALWQSAANASANLSITPITWDIIGLDSNKVTVGPDTFMVGARVCNTGADPATNVVVNFNKLGANSYINLQYSNTLSIASLPAGSSTAIQTRPPNFYGSTPSNCSDFYYNLVITRDSAAYNTTLPYNITASADNAPSVSTPANRQLYIEKLVSQNRNSVASITGPTTVVVGQTYQYTVTGSTATGGYEQLVFSPNFPNVIFQVVGVSATYTSPAGAANNSIYADACGWTNDYTNTTYYHNNQECNDPTIPDGYSGGKAGNNVSTTYTVKILSAGSANITNLIYDFSGSSYHYNSDFGTGINTYTVTAVNAPDVTIAKSHTGSFIQGSTGTYNLNVSNVAPTGSSATSGTVTVTDTLPTGLKPTAATGTGWSCTISGQAVTCTRSDALNPGASYPAIALSVAIATNAPSSLTNTATVAGGGEVNTANDSASDPTTITPAPDLTLTKTHTGNFSQGQTGATYTLTATNSGSATTSGTITVTDILPTGLTPTAVIGTGWTCSFSGQTVTCTRSDALAASASYAPITVTVTVASNAASSITNTASVSGGGEVNTANDSASDPTIITPAPDLTITKTHTGNFSQGQSGATYTLTASNAGSAATTVTVTVTDTLPTGLTPTAASGTGWNCTISGQTVTCTRSDALAASASYAPITVTVTVASSASSSLTNTASVSGGGEVNTANDSASDPTTITATATPDLTITKTHTGSFTQGQTGATYTLTAKNVGSAASTGTVTVTDTLPTGLTPTAASGTGWSCTILGQTVTCTRSDALATSASYPAITLTASVAASAPASITNTATIAGGNDSNTSNNSSSDPTAIGVAGATPQMILVKRITAINGVNITTTVDDPGSSNDNVANWPTPIDSTTGISTYLRGATNGGTIKPGDILEYTIYFLSNGGAAATNINLCDLIPGNNTFVPNSFSSVPESGINLTIGATSTNLTNVPDNDGGQFFNPGATPSVSCSATNTNGAVVVNVVKSPATLPSATAPGTPNNSYGFIRFRAKVN